MTTSNASPGRHDEPASVPSCAQHAAVIVDARRLFREALTGILRHSRLRIVAAAGHITEALEQLNESGDGQVIDLLICSVDPNHGMAPQLEAIKTLRHWNGATKTVLLMPSCTAKDLVAAVLCGVDGVILMDISGEKLIAALDLVMNGQHVLPLGVTRQVFSELEPARAPECAIDPRAAARAAESGQHTAPVDAGPPVISNTAGIAGEGGGKATDFAEEWVEHSASAPRSLGLSDRETQILQCLIQGSANKLIARKLNIAEATVKVHIKGLLRKINVSNRTQAAIWALNQSITSPPPHPESARRPVRPVEALPAAAEAARPTREERLLAGIVAVFPPAHAGPALAGPALTGTTHADAAPAKLI